VQAGVPAVALKFGFALGSPQQQIERDWRTKAVTGVAATTFTPLGIALILGFEPVGAALVALIGVPALAAGLVVQASRRHASPPRRGR
ncbi:MAG: hypothetical protein J7513_17790, partial [Solirubrobacteraceae bacterium]|nr:hypothetical protein [Solirubrobacteraceae bacterium]